MQAPEPRTITRRALLQATSGAAVGCALAGCGLHVPAPHWVAAEAAPNGIAAVRVPAIPRVGLALELVVRGPSGEVALGRVAVAGGELLPVQLGYPYAALAPGQHDYVARLLDAGGAVLSESAPLAYHIAPFRFGC
jgi:hypothetical protein